jgi:DNA helicase-2/ATP-dependent DNA helicase PcrA
MRKLYLTHARRRRVYGDFQYNRPSCFLDEVPTELSETFGRGPAWSAERHRSAWLDDDEEDAPFTETVRIVCDEEDGLRVGTRVRHANFGVGTVKQLEGSGEKCKVTVLFRSVGAKKLMLKYANLQPA